MGWGMWFHGKAGGIRNGGAGVGMGMGMGVDTYVV